MSSLPSFIPKPISSQYKGKKNTTVELGPRQTFGAPWNRHMSLGLDLRAMVTQNPARTGSYSWKGIRVLSKIVLLHITGPFNTEGIQLWIGMFSYPQTHNHDLLVWLKPQIMLLEFIQTANFSPPLPAFLFAHTQRHIQSNILYNYCLETKITKSYFLDLLLTTQYWNTQKQKTGFILIHPPFGYCEAQAI